jgi:glycosyltransferase involved in cell wall biosynthesis
MSTTSAPRVTVLMPVFNAMPFLREAVASILTQGFRDFVLLAIDDGSTDGSVEYLRTVEDARLRILADGVHRGMGAALNFALERVTTEYVARMDGDDLCPPDRFASQVALLDDSPSVGAVGTQFTYMGNAGRTGFARRLPLTHEEIVRDLSSGTLAVIHASLMIRTDLLRSIGGYRFDGIGEDWDMFLRLGEVARFANLPRLGYYYRLHGRNATSLHQRLTQ